MNNQDLAILKRFGVTPDNLSVGGSLDLYGTGITALPDNLRCGRIYLDYIGPLVWRGNLVTIQDIDGYSTVTGGWKRTGDVEVCRARYLAGCDVSEMAQCYVAKQGNIYAHGDTIKDAVCDLKFKIIEGRDISDVVAEIHQTGVVTREQYRVVTGACRAGVAAFLADHGIPDDLESMPLRDVLKLTSGAYGGSDFAAHMEAVKCTSR